MTFCSGCGKENPTGALQCETCGKRFTVVMSPMTAAAMPPARSCPSCNGANRPTALFCRHCGVPMPKAPQAAALVRLWRAAASRIGFLAAFGSLLSTSRRARIITVATCATLAVGLCALVVWRLVRKEPPPKPEEVLVGTDVETVAKVVEGGAELKEFASAEEAQGFITRTIVPRDPLYRYRLHRHRINAAMALKQLDAAVAATKEAAAEFPEQRPELYAELGVFAEGMGNLELAAETYEEGLADSADDPLLQSRMAWLLATAAPPLRDAKRAEALARKACNSTKMKNLAYVDTLAEALLRGGKKPQAVAVLSKALKKSKSKQHQDRLAALKKAKPNDPIAPRPLETEARTADVVPEWREGVPKGPFGPAELALTSEFYAMDLAEKGRWADAMKALAAGLVLSQGTSTYARLTLAQGKVLEAMYHYQDALAVYRRAATQFAGDHRTLNRLAWFLLTAGDVTLRNPAEALSLAQKANELSHDQSPAVIDTLAEALAQNANLELAQEKLRRIISLVPNNKRWVERLEELRSGRTEAMIEEINYRDAEAGRAWNDRVASLFDVAQSRDLPLPELKKLPPLQRLALREAVLARHGAVPKRYWAFRMVSGFPWYKPDYEFTEERLSPVEARNLKRLAALPP